MLLDSLVSAEDIVLIQSAVSTVPREAYCNTITCECDCSKQLVESNFGPPMANFFLILTKLLGVFIELVYLFFYYKSTTVPRIRSAFFDMVSGYCTLLAFRTTVATVVLTYLVIYDALDNSRWYVPKPKHLSILLQTTVYLDWTGDSFSIVLVFLMALHRCLHFTNEKWNDLLFKRSRIVLLVSLCVIFAAIAAVVLIQTSEMQRFYIKGIGFVDSGVPGNQVLISRLFYIFPFGSIICYMILYFHIWQSQRVVSKRNSQNGEQRVFVPLFITILFYGAMCAVFEYISKRDWYQSPLEKINAVAVLKIVNYLPEISLPLMLLISMRRRIFVIVGPRVTDSSITVIAKR